jgi:CHAT domain-containing protein
MQLPGGYRNGFVFVVTSDAPPVWAPLDLDADAMSAAIKAVRAQLEGDGKTRPSDVAGTAWGAKGFDRKASYTLYTSLFGNAAVAERLAKAGHWIIVPQGAFLSLPFAALVTADPAGGGAGDADPEALRATQWLGIGKTLSIVPSVSSLVLLRSAERAAAPRRPATFFGIGEPSMDLWKTALDGDATLRDVIPASRRSQILGLPPIANSEIGPLATAPDIKKLGVLTGPAATEGNLRAAAGPLSQADIVLFATHGLVGTNTTEKLDPVLVLTPPAAMAPGTSYDDATKNDGLLSATEVAALQLNADWVVLSACNTAAGNGTAEGLSGLARAFFSAGARSLLVSQWSLENDVARPLVEGTVVQTIGGGSGQAAALRREMQNLLKDRSRDDVGRSFAHPARWAVFEYVGAD